MADYVHRQRWPLANALRELEAMCCTHDGDRVCLRGTICCVCRTYYVYTEPWHISYNGVRWRSIPRPWVPGDIVAFIPAEEELYHLFGNMAQPMRYTMPYDCHWNHHRWHV